MLEHLEVIIFRLSSHCGGILGHSSLLAFSSFKVLPQPCSQVEVWIVTR